MNLENASEPADGSNYVCNTLRVSYTFKYTSAYAYHIPICSMMRATMILQRPFVHSHAINNHIKTIATNTAQLYQQLAFLLAANPSKADLH